MHMYIKTIVKIKYITTYMKKCQNIIYIKIYEQGILRPIYFYYNFIVCILAKLFCAQHVIKFKPKNKKIH